MFEEVGKHHTSIIPIIDPYYKHCWNNAAVKRWYQLFGGLRGIEFESQIALVICGPHFIYVPFDGDKILQFLREVAEDIKIKF